MYVGTKSRRFDACMHLHLQRCVVFSCSADLNQESRRVAKVSVAWHQYVRQSLAISILHDIWDLGSRIGHSAAAVSVCVVCLCVYVNGMYLYLHYNYAYCLPKYACMYVCMCVCM